MGNMFENAKLGDAYKTRYGKKAIYLGTLHHYELAVDDGDGHYMIIGCYSNGYDRFGDGDSANDIISKWNEPISTKELTELAEQCVDNLGLKSVDFCGKHDDTYRTLKLAWDGYTNSVSKAYIMGYRKCEERLL